MINKTKLLLSHSVVTYVCQQSISKLKSQVNDKAVKAKHTDKGTVNDLINALSLMNASYLINAPLS